MQSQSVRDLQKRMLTEVTENACRDVTDAVDDCGGRCDYVAVIVRDGNGTIYFATGMPSKRPLTREDHLSILGRAMTIVVQEEDEP